MLRHFKTNKKYWDYLKISSELLSFAPALFNGNANVNNTLESTSNWSSNWNGNATVNYLK